MYLERADRHVSLSGLSFVCDICGQELSEREPMIALAGNASSSAFKAGFINPFTTNLEHYGSVTAVPHKVENGPWELCRWGSMLCNRWHGRSRPGCAVHPGCLQLFKRNCTAHDPLDRLWQTCTWRRVPWTGAAVPEIQLLPKPAWYFEEAFLSCAEMCGLKGLDSLPHVVIGNILGWLPRDDCFWRCVTAMHVAKALSVATVQPLRIVPLSWLVSWERGSPPKVASGDAVENVPSLVRFTIDRDGLSKVEKLVEPPQFNRQRFDDKAFVIEREDVFGPSLAVFKNGLLQLSLLEDFEDYKFAVWDTPTPPDLAHCPITLERPLSIRRYHSVDLTAVTGITFFILGGSIFGAHGHTRARPSAMATYQHLGRRVRDLEKYGDWVYVPLPPGDTVVSCGPLVNTDTPSRPRAPRRHRFLVHSYPPLSLVSRPTSLQANREKIRMRLSGETIVGRHMDQDNRLDSDFVESGRYAFFLNRPEHPPTTLLYSTGPDWPKEHISIITTYGSQGQDGTLEPWPAPPPGEPSSVAMHSHAPLENICQVRMFYYSNSHRCKGMLLDYDDGGQRAVGDCRLHVDPSTTFERPSRLAFLDHKEYGEGVEVLFDALPSADDPGLDNWLYYEMKGTLDFWLHPRNESISVRGGAQIPQMDLWEEVPEGE